ncbi:hypothetical protein FRC01_003358 [Tulasnella sp. 417]|nr:hypothetical protein FRC01_003358 [Tulasnella sp. 417]
MESGRKTLYVYNKASWPSAPWLAVYALGYEDVIDVEDVDLAAGANFDPEFLKINPKGTVPALVLPGEETLFGTVDTLRYLIANAPQPAGKPSGTDFIKRVHDESIDAHTALFSARDEAELDIKRKGICGTFLSERQKALQRYRSLDTAGKYKELYDYRYEHEATQRAVYFTFGSDPAIDSVKQAYFSASEKIWRAIRSFILDDVPRYLPEGPGFIGGERPGEDDFHFIVWLARIVLLTGGAPDADGVLTLKKELGGEEVPGKVVSFWRAWCEMQAWKVVYGGGLH